VASSITTVPSIGIDVAGEAAAAETPSVADGVPRNTPFHAALQGR
jgi:hypothetical protein